MKKTIDYIMSLNTIKYIMQNKTTIIIVIATALLFLSISYFIYVNSIIPLINRDYVANKEFISSSNNSVSSSNNSVSSSNNSTVKKDVIIYFFYTEWCPYCKKALPEWHNFKTFIESSPKYDLSYNIIFKEIDCEKKPGLANTYKVEGYPTIKLIYNGDVYNYHAKPNESNLVEFLDGSLYSKKATWLGGLISI